MTADWERAALRSGSQPASHLLNRTGSGASQRPRDPGDDYCRPTAPENVVIATWEDDLDEFDRRLAAIGRHDATGGRIKFVDMADHGPLWAPLRSGHVSSIASLTTAGEKLREYAESVEARLLVIDPLAAAYAGDENVRGLVRAFLSSWDAWGRRNGCAVLFVGHTPKSISRTSGSTDWRNAVRNLWSMEYKFPPKAGPAEMTEDKAALILECEKRNYGPKPPIVYLDREGRRADRARGARLGCGFGSCGDQNERGRASELRRRCLRRRMLNLGDIIIGSIRQTLSLARSYGWRGSRPETGGYGRPLHQAAEAGGVSTALAMLHSGASVNERDELGRSPLHAAVDGGDPGMVRALIEAGARLEERDKRGQTPLFWAAYLGQTRDLDVLVGAGAQLEARSKNRVTPLMAAAASRHLMEPELSQHFRALIECGADIRANDGSRTTAMHLAAAGANLPIMQVLHDAGVDFDVPNSDGLTPMHFAAQIGFHPAIELLASWGADADARSRTRSCAHRHGLGFGQRDPGTGQGWSRLEHQGQQWLHAPPQSGRRRPGDRRTLPDLPGSGRGAGLGRWLHRSSHSDQLQQSRDRHGPHRRRRRRPPERRQRCDATADGRHQQADGQGGRGPDRGRCRPERQE